MKSKEQVFTELLFELNEICDKNDIKYSIIGPEARYLIQEKTMPVNIDGLTVAMTIGDVEKLIKSVKSNGKRGVEYYLNNDNARDFGIRFYNNETLYVDVRDFRNHVMRGHYIEIMEVERIPIKKNKKKAALVKKICKGANINNYTVRNIKNIVLSVFIRLIRTVVGKERFKRTIYDMNRKFVGIASWDQISKYKKVKVGDKVISNLNSQEIKNINVDGNQVMLVERLADADIKERYSTQYYEKYIITETEPINSENLEKLMYDEIKAIAKKIDAYAAKQKSSAKAKSNIKQAWDMYLFSREKVEQERKLSKDI